MPNKCWNCVHFSVCKFRPESDSSDDEKRIVQTLCEDFISDRKIVDPKVLLGNLDEDISIHRSSGGELDIRKWLGEYLKSFKEDNT